MHPNLAAPDDAANAVPVTLVDPAELAARASADRRLAAFTEQAGFDASAGTHLLLQGEDGALGEVLFGLGPDGGKRDRFICGRLPQQLPAGTYRLSGVEHDRRLATLAFLLGAYRFDRYRDRKPCGARLVCPEGVDAAEVSRIAEATVLARDLVNTPSNDMGPQELQDATFALARAYGAEHSAVVGDELLAQNFPLIHAVGKASTRAPRLIELRWGEPSHPKVTLVGKGVCFDTGGLDIKPESAMLIMKKDMGGAAAVLAAARMIMDRRLPVRLRVLIPAVENAISGAAFRPLDVYRARNGLTVEIGNTDAEGRLVLADALALADEEAPDLLVDMGTLTGAARVALGPEVVPFYTDDDALAGELAAHAQAENDPIWRMPLWRPYAAMLESKVADTGNVGGGAFAGSITCALFLSRFVSAAKSWAHFDIYAWNPSAKPGRPEGGECQAARALYATLAARYG